MFWLLLTGNVPTEAETRQLSLELAEKGDLPTYVEKLIDGLGIFFVSSASTQNTDHG
jgi:citrate synthase